MALVAVNPMHLPVALSIGTKNAFDGGYEYHYRYLDDINAYVCDHQTTSKVDGEVMAIQLGYEAGTTWYIASEGVMVDGQTFAARQFVFRTNERFWEPGRHEWQLNANSSSTNRDKTMFAWGDATFAFTEVPENVDVIPLAVGLQRLDSVV